MEIPHDFQLRDVAYWVNLTSVLISTTAILIQVLPNTSESVKVISCIFSDATGYAGVLAFGVDSILELKDFKGVEFRLSTDIIFNRRLQTLLMLATNFALYEILINIKPYQTIIR